MTVFSDSFSSSDLEVDLWMGEFWIDIVIPKYVVQFCVITFDSVIIFLGDVIQLRKCWSGFP